jgi:hypothetical protein
MFSTYDTSAFPLVKVTIQDIPHEDEFDIFLQNWMQLYKLNQEFSFIFDIRKIGNISPIYCIKMSLFIRNIRQQDPQYLKKSIILINDNRIKRLLDFIFYLQSPVADVFIINTDENIDNYTNKIDEINCDNLTENMIYIKPNNSVLPFM